MQEDNGQAYRSCELKVSFKSIYQECLGRAKEHFAAQPVESVDAPEPEPAQEQPEALDPRAGYSGEAEEALPEAPEVPEAPRIRGPQLPGATVGDVGADSASESDAEAGPRREGEEREGVDLRYVVPKKSRREEWMTMAPESISAALHQDCHSIHLWNGILVILWFKLVGGLRFGNGKVPKQQLGKAMEKDGKGILTNLKIIEGTG